MQLLKPEWVNHDGDKAIFSVDLHPDGSRFATGGQGQDSSGRVVIWNLKPVVYEKFEEDEKVPRLLCQLDQHLGCVNCVRWSHAGRYLASAGDDKVIIIWQQSRLGGGAVFGSNVVNVESWRSVTTLRGHNGDILDVAWSPGDVWLASASVDNNVIIWNTAKWPEQVRVLRGHTGLVKGVTWDPVGRYLASQADDKSLRIWRTADWGTEEKIVEPFTEVLDLSWSNCGRCLMAVSKDGTLAFINFSMNEIGHPLSEDETNNLHIKLYGKSAVTSASSVNPAIIENAEILRLREEESERAKAASSREFSQRPTPATPLRAPINKQIETRTADGKRRITPMFIPPTEGVDSPSKSYEASFSSSQQEKSKIVVEKVDQIVEPNVSSTRNTFSGSLSGTPSKPPAPLPEEFNGMPAALPARLERSEKVHETQGSCTPIVSGKRKHDDPQPIVVKRKRGRPAMYDRTPAAPPSRASTPPPVAQGPPSRPQPVVTTVQPVDVIHILPEASLSKSARIQIPGEPSGDSPGPLLVVENDHRVGSGSVGVGSSVPNLHRVTREQVNLVSWVLFFTSQVTAASATAKIATISCRDKTLHIVDIKTGEMMLPPLQLPGRASQLFVEEDIVIVLTTDATLIIWDISKKKRLLSESIRYLVEGRSGGVKSVSLALKGTPVVLLTSGEAFARCQELEAWLLLGESSSVRRVLQPEYTMLPQCYQSNPSLQPLNSLLHQTAAYSGSSRVSRPLISDDVRQSMTEVYLDRMLTSARYLHSSQDYKFWLKRKVQFLIKEGQERKLRVIFDDFLGPRHSGHAHTDEAAWSPNIMDMDKKSLLEEFLREILLAENSLQLQRLYSEYKSQVDGDVVENI
ncbi:protein HIRA isoform X4 [Macrobrachium rosenbergii]|uniref:protein HIRA isoform X4 n=1 Tax=Macrobrachium rosenbergii TaxID=79674 RepID=UPI0034D4962E